MFIYGILLQLFGALKVGVLEASPADFLVARNAFLDVSARVSLRGRPGAFVRAELLASVVVHHGGGRVGEVAGARAVPAGARNINININITIDNIFFGWCVHVCVCVYTQQQVEVYKYKYIMGGWTYAHIHTLLWRRIMIIM